MHKHLFPALEQAYKNWVNDGRRGVFEELVPQSERHWSALAGRMLETYRSHPGDFAGRLLTLIEDSKL